MKNSFVHFALAAFLLAVSVRISAEEIVAVLDLKFIEETDKTAVVMCYGNDDDDCGVWAVHYMFEAKVDKVISGNLPDKRFLVLFGKHALARKNIRNVVALLKKLDVDDPDEPQYQITQWGERRKMYCFDRREDDETEVGVEVNGKYQLNGYDPEYYY